MKSTNNKIITENSCEKHSDKNNSINNRIFGPVLSRRFGFSLGVDLVPHKTCPFDCIYCECGKTTNLTLEIKSFFDKTKIINELKNIIDSNKKIDYITFSGSGEPTLSSDIGSIISFIKSFCEIPVCVLTNGSLLFLESVRNNLLQADVVVPSLDAVNYNIFNIINRPVNNLFIDNIIEGLITFSNIFSGKLYLEILLVKDVNDSIVEINNLVRVVKKINADKIQLNTCVRPGTVSDIIPLDYNELLLISQYFDVPVEIIYKSSTEKCNKKNMILNPETNFNRNNKLLNDEDIISILSKRPCSLKDIMLLTAKSSSEISMLLEKINNNIFPLKKVIINDDEYFSKKD